MRLSLSWLSDYLDLSGYEPSHIAELFTSLGLEVEECLSLPSIDEKVLVGEIIAIEPHPKADSLQVCQVNTGKEEPLTIVCGARNPRKGMKTAVATIGSVLPGGLTIQATELRGQRSEGMLCSADELGICEGQEGILELEDSCTAGVPLKQYIDTKDTVLTLSVTPNRADCLSYLGLARDLGAKIGRPLNYPSVKGIKEKASFKTKDFLGIRLASSVGCARFVGSLIKGVAVTPAPLWMQRRLHLAGMRSKNLIVDITNYLMLESGQPMHAYDARAIQGGWIGVREANKSETLQTLDGTLRQLQPSDLLIHDAEQPLGLAGVMGGAYSEIKEDTKDIFIEVAQFDPVQVRKTSKRLALRSEASMRFERGVDISQIPFVCHRAQFLLYQSLRHAGLDEELAIGDLLDAYPREKTRSRIALRLKRVRRILGLPHINLDTCIKHLMALGFELADKTEERMLFDAPLWRHDIIREVDLIEEIGRLEGFDKIPSELPRMVIQPNHEHMMISFGEKLSQCLATCGLSEVKTYPFHNLDWYKTLGLTEQHLLWPKIELANPLSEQMGHLRTSCVPDLLQAALHNRSKGGYSRGCRLFTITRGFFDPKQAAGFDQGLHLTQKAQGEKERIIEKKWFAGILDTPFMEKDWLRAAEPVSFFHGKALVEKIGGFFGLKNLSYKKPQAEQHPFLHPGASAVISYGPEELGFIGLLHPKVAKDFGFKKDLPLIFEMDMDLFHKASLDQKKAGTRAPARFPAVIRDFAFTLPQKVLYGEFKAALDAFPQRKHLWDAAIFDVYEGSSIAEGMKSFAISTSFRHSERTLTDKEVDQEVQDLTCWLEMQVSAVLRA